MSENVQTFSGKVNVADNLLVGTSHFFVDRQNNRVGIGTSTPDASSMLDVTGNIKSGGTITATGGFSGNGSGLSGVNSDSGSWVKDDTNGLIYVANSAHKVGIGTTDPVTPFELVVGTSAAPLTAETTVMQLNSTLDGSSSDHKCYFKFQYVPESNPVNWTDWSGRIQFVTDATNQGYIEFNPPGAEYAIAFGNTGGGSAAGEIMRLLGTGNVGIGTTSPGVALDVAGTIRGTGGIITGTSDALLTVTNTTTPAILRTLTTGGQVYFQSGTAATSDSRANINFTSMYNGTNYLTIKGSTGNVGIGNTDAICKLTVGDLSHAVNSGGGVLAIRQRGNTSDDGITITSSHANSARLYKDGSGHFNIHNTGGGSLQIQNNSGTIVSTGHVYLGQGSGQYQVWNSTNAYGGITVHRPGGGNLAYNISTDQGGGWRWRFVDSTAASPGADYFVVYYASGNYWHKGVNASDRRLKENIESIDGQKAITKILEMNPVTFNWIKNPGKVRGGFIAQEMYEVLPELVDYDEENDIYAIDLHGIYAFAIAAIQVVSRNLQITRTELSDIKTELKEDLQTTKEDLQSKATLEDLQTVKTQLQTTNEQNQKLEARIAFLETALISR